MLPAPYQLLGNYAALTRRLEKLPGGSTATKQARAAAVAALKTRHESLITAHQKLLDATAEYEASAAEAVSHVNKSLAAVRRASPSLSTVVEQQLESAMHEGARHLGTIARHRRPCDDEDPPPSSSSSSASRG